MIYRNNGYATEATRAYVKYFFEHYKETELVVLIRDENKASWKTIEAAGFVCTDKRLYKDVNDKVPQLYRFYIVEGNLAN